MITSLLINFVLLTLGSIFSFLPVVDKLPTVGGFDIDAYLVTAMGYARTFFVTFWPLTIMFEGFLILMGYYIVKNLLVRLFLGHRTPGDK